MRGAQRRTVHADVTEPQDDLISGSDDQRQCRKQAEGEEVVSLAAGVCLRQSPAGCTFLCDPLEESHRQDTEKQRWVSAKAKPHGRERDRLRWKAKAVLTFLVGTDLMAS